MRITQTLRRHRVRTATVLSATAGLIALSGAGLAATVGAAPPQPAAGPGAVVPRRQCAGSRQRWSGQPGAVRDHLDGHARGRRQARVADHPGEQVLRRDLHRPQPEQLPLADAAAAGRPPDELLRHRSLQHGQLHLTGVRAVAVLRGAGRLLDDGEHDEQQQRDHHDRHGGTSTDTDHTTDGSGHQHHDAERHRAPTTATTDSSSCTAASTPPWPTTAASTRPTSRPCSTSTTRPASPGRPTPRTWVVPSPSARPRTRPARPPA